MNDHEAGEPADHAAAGVRFRLFGPPMIEVAGVGLTVRDQKAQALLYYLAVTDHACTRDHLATLLWSETLESNARHSLRSSLYHLRHALGDTAAAITMPTDRNLIRLLLPEDACDVPRFRMLVAANDERLVAAAVALYRGPLLEGITLTDAPVFEDWLRSERDSMRRAYLNALDRLATWAEAREAWDEAIAHVQRIVGMDTLNEAAQQRLMRLYLRIGAAVRALRQYQQLAAELGRELDLSPSPETQELLQQALRTRRPAAVPRIATGSPATDTGTDMGGDGEGGDSLMPCVGRDDLLGGLRAIAQRAREGRGATILLQGETGMGKTRLLRELAAALEAQSPPWIVLHGACSPFDDLLSYGPFYDALQTAAPGDLTDLLGREHGQAHTDAGAVMWRVLQVLRLLSQGGPVMLVIDDLHWANSSTLHLFGFLATRIHHLPILLVASMDRVNAIPAVQRLLALGRPHGDVHLASLTPLGREDVSALLHTQGISPDAAATLAEWLHIQSGGSPFMIAQILAQLRADAILTPTGTGTGWHLNEARWLRQRVAFTLPETTHDLVAWRLAPLATDALHLLDVLAVAGQPLPFELLSDLPGVSRDHALQTVEDLLGRGLLVETGDGAFALPHHLLRETLLARLSHLRRRTIHSHLLASLEKCPALRARFPLRQLALHAVAAEDIERARRYGLRVLEELLRDPPRAETLGFAQHLYDLLAPTAVYDERLRLAHALGELHQSVGQLGAAADWHRQQLDIARAAGDSAAQAAARFDSGELALVSSDYLAAVAEARAGLELLALVAPRGEQEGAEEAEEIEEAAAPTQAGLAGRGYRLLGAALAMEGRDLSAAGHYLQRAVALHRSAGEPSDLCAALFELGNVAAQRGELAHALDCYAEAGVAAEAGHVHFYHALAQNNFAYHSLLLGRPEAAQQAAALGQRVAETHELAGALLHLYSTQGEIALYGAEWPRAAEWFGRGLTLAEELGNLERQAGYRAGLALGRRGEGDLEGATALLEECLTLIAGQGHWHLRTRLQLWLAETWLLRGGPSEAEAYLDEALVTARTQERALLLIQGERLYARLFAEMGKWPEAPALFGSALERAARLDLPLEVARVQAAWGEATLRHASPSSAAAGRELLAAACETFTVYHARADLEAMSEVIGVSRLR